MQENEDGKFEKTSNDYSEALVTELSKACTYRSQ